MPLNDPDATKVPRSTLWLPPLSPKEQQRIDRSRRRQQRPRFWFIGGFKGKTIWDYLNLLAVLAIPVLIAGGTLWYTNQQSQATTAANADQQQETALQTYLDRMSDLLFTEHLATSQPGDEARQVARARTLTLLPQLNPIRKGEVVRFLYEAKLIGYLQQNGKNQAAIVDLSQADLDEAELFRADLDGADLSGTDLTLANMAGANMHRSDLNGANLDGANLDGSDLSGADLNEAVMYLAGLYLADLTGADLTGAVETTTQQLSTAYSLKGAVLPDGSKHP